jgi:trimeric autotransporter adhesin
MMKKFAKKHMLLICVFTLLLSVSGYSQSTTANWQPVGPIAFPTNLIGQINGMGRVVQMKYDPVTPNKAYAVSVNSVFVTTNNAETWSVLPGLNPMPATACASVCIDYANPQVIYLGTGDPNYYSTTKASGVWKSTNGGSSFSLSNNGMGNRLVVDIAMHPTNPNILVAATNNGMYRSTDGGANWIQTSTVTNITGFAQNKASGSLTMYFTKCDANASGLLYTSTDFGATWTQNTNLSTPVYTYRGARVATTPANANVIYVSFLGSGGGGPGASVTGGGVVYKSTDGGASFTLQKGDVLPNLIGYNDAEGGQGNYNFDMAVSPTDANTLIISGHVIWKSTNSGVSWTKMQTSWAVEIHTDMHYTIWNPNNPNEVFNCNDGGVWKSTDGGDNWVQKNQNLVATEFYHFANSRFNSGVIGGGAQDNGEMYYSNNTWYCNRGGDFTSNYYFDNNAALPGKAYYVGRGRVRDLITQPSGTGSEKNINLPFTADNEDQYTFSFQNPSVGFVMHNFNSDAPSETNVGGIYRTNNLQTISTGNPTWTKIYPWSDASVFFTMEVNPTNADTLYAVARNKDILRSDNALSTTPTFTTVKTGSSLSTELGLPSTATTEDLEVMKNGVVYLAVNGKVIRSGDRGATWTDYTGVTTGIYVALPSTTNYFEIIQDSTENNESIYAASVNGVYFRNRTMPGWIQFMNNLPTTPNFTDIDIFNSPVSRINDRLRLSTYGRGLWETLPYKAATVLAVRTLTLRGVSLSFSNRLDWKTTNEVGLLNFEIQRSADGANFTTIATKTAEPFSANTISYIDYDYQIQSRTHYYYRIKVNDNFGGFYYSNIVLLTSTDGKLKQMGVFKNPINRGEPITVILESTKNQKATVVVYDTKGSLIYSTSFNATIGRQFQELMPNTPLTAGMYLIKLQLEDGTEFTNKIIQH